jgi:eukaryotic-like serine/threonine-protein kinase
MALLLSGPELPAARGATRRLSWPALSPDGHWLTYVSNESGHNDVYVQRFPELGDRQQLSRDGGRAPVWRRDGRELFYVEERTGTLMATDVRLGGRFSAGELRGGLHSLTSCVPAYDVSPDGERFLFVRCDLTPIPPSQMQVVLNWFEELKAKVPARR